jgi:GTPase SAR1 family protein
MVVGQENTGKTSLVRQLLRSVDVKKGGDKSEVSTDGITVIDFSTNLRINPEGEKRAVEFSTWDFAGQEV